MSSMLSSDHLIPGTKILLEDYTRLGLVRFKELVVVDLPLWMISHTNVLNSNKFDNNHAETILGKRKEQLFEDLDKSAFREGML
nr:5539_t:CDS:2 [Entrophospora candida]